MEDILAVKNLTLKFGALAAVDDLTFSVRKGEIFGIAGPNGAGKTTLFNAITGVYRSTGDILFYGKQINGLKPHVICQKGIARTFQASIIFSSMTVESNIRAGATFGHKRASKEKVKETTEKIMELLSIQEKSDVVVHGARLFDKKLVMLGAALATEPKLLFLDEPLGGLSPQEILQSVEIFKKINKEMKITLVVIEHIMKFLMLLSDRLMILSNGKSVILDIPEKVAKNKKVVEIYLGEEYAVDAKD
ncbi:MAG: ATP-binding cassette domain-containing protein [Oscillospiraceae bacterium]|nr:ATP-binding cassette domain-containing protein [Oscillospiraceae bacterium]